MTYQLKRQPADVVVALDRSTSMNRMVSTANTNTLWAETTSALDEVVMKTDAAVSWGLKWPHPTTRRSAGR